MICVSCNSNTNEHYSYPGKDGARVFFSKCKACHNPARIKKGTGFVRLPMVQQDRIKASLLNRKNKIKDIAMAEGLTYENLRRWVAKGLL